ncbi:TetR/AcrR family transcriptional regulator [Streptomyces sp. A7024]|uniref:TetR/AcrR family transcriptional regulator n=1 Tax=Streptomyces coryli TaxID=1128680 RepID=A0A6G4UDK5_9ACTN|nr:TetR/AcrR family transcriptional regulator [Streptomyces coryli]NGN70305.1 TetR/AcrR family transcriptional regulator [Streptomyces coryli]
MSARREEAVDAAMAIADEKGLAAVSMRAVAQRVGVTPMALYPHVGSKAALLDLMVGRLLSMLGEDPAMRAAADADWRTRLRVFASSARLGLQTHPWATGLLFDRPTVTPEAVAVIDKIYSALLDAGVPGREVPRVERLVSTFVLGYVASEVGGRFGPGELDPRGRRGQLPEGALPAHARVAEALDAPVDWDEEFKQGFEEVLRLVESVAAGSRGGARAR